MDITSREYDDNNRSTRAYNAIMITVAKLPLPIHQPKVQTPPQNCPTTILPDHQPTHRRPQSSKPIKIPQPPLLSLHPPAHPRDRSAKDSNPQPYRRPCHPCRLPSPVGQHPKSRGHHPSARNSRRATSGSCSTRSVAATRNASIWWSSAMWTPARAR